MREGEKKIKSMPPSEEKEYEVNRGEKGTRKKRNQTEEKKDERTRERENNRFYIQSKVTLRDDHHYTTQAASIRTPISS